MMSLKRTLISQSSVLPLILLTACSSMLPDEIERAPRQQPGDYVIGEIEKQGDKSQLTDKPGLIRIQRHTKEYSISMTLDASDDNVYFVMDLPEDETAKTNLDDVDEAADEDAKAGQEDLHDQQENLKAKQNIDERRPAQSGKHILYAQTYFFEKKYGRALDEVNRAIEYSPDSAVAYSLRGSILFKQGRGEQARASWEKALELDPSLDNVSRMLEQQGDRQ